MKTKIFGLLLLAGGLCLTACDDFLTETPKHSLTTDNSVLNYSGAKNAVNGIYGVYETYGSNLGGSLYSNLHCMAGFWKYNNEMFNMGYKQSSSSVEGYWTQLYKILNTCNAAINGINKLSDGSFPSLDEKNALLGEARCFRGYCNLELLWLFGRWFDKADSPYGILYRDQTSELSNLMVGRISVGESYRLILEDLEFAEQNAPVYKSALRMSRQFAKAMHAKLLMVRNWDGDYAKALTLVNDLLAENSGWQMETDLAKLYETGWNSKENCFSHYLGDNKDSYFGMAGSEFTYAYALFYNNEFTETVQEWLDNDVRHDVTFGTARAPETWDTSTKENVLTKLYHRGRNDGKNDMYATYPMRYAELYLMKAELLARTNPSDIEGALAPINEMRAKYTNPVMEPITGITNHQELMDAIFKEYVVSLFMENETPWFASLRFEHEGKPWIYTLKPEVNFSTDQYCWPIPDSEIHAHSNVVEQNPGLE